MFVLCICQMKVLNDIFALYSDFLSEAETKQNKVEKYKMKNMKNMKYKIKWRTRVPVEME